MSESDYNHIEHVVFGGGKRNCEYIPKTGCNVAKECGERGIILFFFLAQEVGMRRFWQDTATNKV
jgi:hypothetical protein